VFLTLCTGSGCAERETSHQLCSHTNLHETAREKKKTQARVCTHTHTHARTGPPQQARMMCIGNIYLYIGVTEEFINCLVAACTTASYEDLFGEWGPRIAYRAACLGFLVAPLALGRTRPNLQKRPFIFLSCVFLIAKAFITLGPFGAPGWWAPFGGPCWRSQAPKNTEARLCTAWPQAFPPHLAAPAFTAHIPYHRHARS